MAIKDFSNRHTMLSIDAQPGCLVREVCGYLTKYFQDHGFVVVAPFSDENNIVYCSSSALETARINLHSRELHQTYKAFSGGVILRHGFAYIGARINYSLLAASSVVRTFKKPDKMLHIGLRRSKYADQFQAAKKEYEKWNEALFDIVCGGYEKIFRYHFPPEHILTVDSSAIKIARDIMLIWSKTQKEAGKENDAENSASSSSTPKLLTAGTRSNS